MGDVVHTGLDDLVRLNADDHDHLDLDDHTGYDHDDCDYHGDYDYHCDYDHDHDAVARLRREPAGYSGIRSTILPSCSPRSIRSCAAAAFASGNTRSTTGLTLPAATSS